MIVLFNYFIDLCLLRSNPQDLPASKILLWLSMLVSLLAEMLLLAIDSDTSSLFSIFATSVFDLIITLLTLQTALNWQGQAAARFSQTATALLGSGAILNILMAITDANSLGWIDLEAILSLILFLWYFIVTGHILHHAFDITLGQGIIASVIYTLIASLVVNLVFPMAP